MALLTDKYFSRIDAHPGPQRDLATLAALQLAHMRSVPFENLDIMRRTPLALAQDALLDKIVGRRRGGICYELNGAFAALLQQLGYQLTVVSAQVCLPDGKLTPEFDHMALLVDVAGRRYLVDVGFGEPSTLLAPLDLAERGVQQVAGGRCRLTQDGPAYTLTKLNAVDGVDVPKPMYRFTATPRTMDDFLPQARFHQESAESPFARTLFCSIATAEGRTTLRGDVLTVTRGADSGVTALDGRAAVDGAIATHFGLRP